MLRKGASGHPEGAIIGYMVVLRDFFFEEIITHQNDHANFIFPLTVYKNYLFSTSSFAFLISDKMIKKALDQFLLYLLPNTVFLFLLSFLCSFSNDFLGSCTF